MSKARLAGLLGALVAYAGGSIAWTTLTPGPAMATVTIPVGAPPESGDLSDFDLATLRDSEARAAAQHQAKTGDAAAGQSKAIGADPVLNPHDIQPIGRPSPTSWLLLVIGVGMIGGALRGFIVANRALARLQPEERE